MTLGLKFEILLQISTSNHISVGYMSVDAIYTQARVMKVFNFHFGSKVTLR
ncbi:hypothetical protein CA2015_1817 [Cyclobacterium amurskyense]|uniref:Uncharacterized protein n=1 Tax=Cyclobacterium amurskyense TaxID=320787 RepID=A0A0H4PDQ3_9BACT|nr:hypothetical protein CA2015_1817 [Cyclobacterium amurskyense]